MTFQKSSIGQSLLKTRTILTKQLWLWPILAFLFLSTIGFYVRSAIESTMKVNLKQQLETLLRVETAMLDNWYQSQIAHAESVANDARFREQFQILLAEETIETENPSGAVHEARLKLRRELRYFLDRHDLNGFFVSSRNREIVAANADEMIGQKNIKQYEPFISRVIDGESVVSAPFASVFAVKDENGSIRTGTPTMFACAPIRDTDQNVIGVLALRIRPELEFTRILQLGRMGTTGETYAFDQTGLMVSRSRFEHELILNGCIPDVPNSTSILVVQLRTPDGDLTDGYRPKVRRSEMPLTMMAAAATSGENGTNVEGYRDYRGVSVVGTWVWLPKQAIGVACEMSAEEAFRPLTILRWTFWSLYSLLVLASLLIFVFTLVLSRMRREAQKAAIETQELGQYRLESKLGAGAMGIVYKGFHQMMRRPTAIKLLNVEAMNDNAIKRFEREVQITCQLNHPNTIAIYDYGRTPEGVFYYAMEFLDGIDLQTLVNLYGPQSDGRVVQILLQICGSLYEAHSQGLVHRDIKPANLMLNRRGGQPDVVKVLDFGLVKTVDANKHSQDAEQGLAGTPLYLSPEAIQSPELVDACSDLYAVGAVGYFLLTGKTVFEAKSLADLLQKHLTEPPIPPSRHSKAPLSAELEHAILSCLEKSRARRPQTARDLADLLSRCPVSKSWTLAEADAWWSQHERQRRNSAGNSVSSDAPIVDSMFPSSDSSDRRASTAKESSVKTQLNLLDQTILHE